MGNWLASLVNWQEFPGAWVSLLIIVFLVGLWLPETLDRNSSLRRRLRAWFGVFTLEKVFSASPQAENGYEWLEIRISITFISNFNGLRLSIYTDSNINVPHAREKFLIVSHKYGSVVSGQPITLTVANVPLSAPPGQAGGYSSWGDRHRLSGDVEGIKSFGENTEHIVEICARAGLRRQKEKIFIKHLNQKGGEMGRVFLRPLPFREVNSGAYPN